MKNNIIQLIADELSKQNKTVTVHPGSMLTILNPHEAANESKFNGLDGKLAGILGNEIGNIKNNIIPMIKQYGVEVAAIIGDRAENNPLANINIISADVPDVINELASRGTINIRSNTSVQSISESLNLPTPSAGSIRAMFKLGSGSIATLVNDFGSTVSDANLVRIWETYLSRITPDNSNYIALGSNVRDGLYANDLYVLSILVKSLSDNTPEGVRASAGTYSSVITTLNNALDAKIGKVISLLDSYAKIGRVIIKAESAKEIVVVKTAYEKFLKDGGEPELVYGYVLGGGKTASSVTLMEDRDKLIATWNKYISSENIKTKLGSIEHYRMAYTLGLTKVLNDYISDEFKATIPVSILDNHNDLVVQYMNSVDHMELYEVQEVITDIITKIIVSHTNAGMFLGSMKHYSAMDKSLTANEAATYASMDLVVAFLLTQITVA